MQKLLFIDTETTGLHPNENGIWQLAGLIEIDGKLVDEFNLYMNPGDVIYTDIAMEVGNVTPDEIKTFPDHTEVMKEFQTILGDYVNKFDKSDKFNLVAYNSRFDDAFVREWFNRNNDNYYGSYFWSNFIDVHTLVGYLLMDIRDQVNSFKLSNIVELFNIEIKEAHNALYDIKATYELFKTIQKEHLIKKLN